MFREAIFASATGGLLVALSLMLCGCMGENTGSSTIVGEQSVMPEITDSSDSVSVRVYESIEGARVWTAKDSKVAIKYANDYTNEYFGVVTKRKHMSLDVRIEPLEVGGGMLNMAEDADGDARKSGKKTKQGEKR